MNNAYWQGLKDDLHFAAQHHKETYDEFDPRGVAHAFTKSHPEVKLLGWVYTQLQYDTERVVRQLRLDVSVSEGGSTVLRTIEVTV